MARARMLSRAISTSEKVNRDLQVKLRENGIKNVFKGVLLYSWLHPHSDDFGRMDGTPYWVKLNVVPALDFSENEIAIILKSLNDVGLIIYYDDEHDKKVIQITKFTEHQIGLNKRTASKFQAPINQEGEFSYSEEDIEKYFYNNIKQINGKNIKTKERQVRRGNSYLDIVMVDSDLKEWIFEIKRTRLSLSAQNQIIGYLDQSKRANGILIGFGISTGYKTNNNIYEFIYDETLSVSPLFNGNGCYLTIDNTT
jgi:hypothetical protein